MRLRFFEKLQDYEILENILITPIFQNKPLQPVAKKLRHSHEKTTFPFSEQSSINVTNFSWYGRKTLVNGYK